MMTSCIIYKKKIQAKEKKSLSTDSKVATGGKLYGRDYKFNNYPFCNNYRMQIAKLNKTKLFQINVLSKHQKFVQLYTEG